MVNLELAGKKSELRRERAEKEPEPEQIALLPNFALKDLSGKSLSAETVKGHVVVVEFWATWCPPCRSTLQWLEDVKKKYGTDLEVLAIAVESPEDKVRTLVNSSDPKIHWAISDAATARAFGDVVAVPTMLVFDREGKTAHVFYGAPPDLHEQTAKLLQKFTTPRP